MPIARGIAYCSIFHASVTDGRFIGFKFLENLNQLFAFLCL